MDRYLIRVRVARPGSQTEPGREALGPRAVERLRTLLAAMPGSEVITVAEQDDAVVGMAWLDAWNRASVRQLARAVFAKTNLRGGIAASYQDELFFQLATPGGSAGWKWREDAIPMPRVAVEGEDVR